MSPVWSHSTAVLLLSDNGILVCFAVVGKPDGACLTDAECSTDMQCDKSNTTNKVNKCFGGMDTITQYGACVAKPPSRANLPACTRCSQCITALRPSAEAAALNLTATRTYLGAAFYAACSGAQYSLTACRDVQALVESSVAGNLARRVGALCVRLGECSSALSTDSSCTLTANATTAAVQVLVQPVAVVVSNDTNTTVTANTTVSVDSTVTVISGKLDTCTIEGVSSGGMVLGTFKYGQGRRLRLRCRVVLYFENIGLAEACNLLTHLMHVMLHRESLLPEQSAGPISHTPL